MRVGRKGDTDLRINMKNVSSNHLTVERPSACGGLPVLRDTSSNGSFLDGVRAEKGEPVEIKDGAELTLVAAEVISFRCRIPARRDAPQTRSAKRRRKEAEEARGAQTATAATAPSESEEASQGKRRRSSRLSK